MTYIELKDELLDNALTQEEAEKIKNLPKSELESILSSLGTDEISKMVIKIQNRHSPTRR